jgi:S1-C subfamily serine protease
VTLVDGLVLVLVALAALSGLRKGLVWGVLSAVGLLAGALAGARIAPHLLPGDDSPYTPLVTLVAAVSGAFLLEALGTAIALQLRRPLRATPLRAVDAAGGLVFGAGMGLFIAWVAGAVALHFPGQPEMREAVQESRILGRVNEIVPPAELMEAIERVDPFPSIIGPAPPDEPTDPAVLEQPGVRQAAPSVVRVLGSACGLAMTGSGWVAAPNLVVTNAHVIAGQRNTTVQAAGGRNLRADAVAFDVRNDVAVLRVQGLDAPALTMADATAGSAVAIIGYPGGGGLTVTPGRLGSTRTVVAPDAYGRGRVQREVTSFRGDVRRGNSGGPAVNADGEVETTIFAARAANGGGFGIPPSVVQDSLDSANGPVSTGPCVAR